MYALKSTNSSIGDRDHNSPIHYSPPTVTVAINDNRIFVSFIIAEVFTSHFSCSKTTLFSFLVDNCSLHLSLFMMVYMK